MRLIDADSMREEWLENGENEYVYDTNAFLESIDAQPTIDAVPVVKGKWKKVSEKAPKYACTHCDHLFNNKGYKFCPWCGADMRKGGNK